MVLDEPTNRWDPYKDSNSSLSRYFYRTRPASISHFSNPKYTLIYAKAEESNREVILDLHFAPLIFELLRILYEMFLHLFGLLHIKQFDGCLEFSDGWLILLQYEIDACFDLMNVPQLEDFAVLLLFIWDELVQLLYVL